MIQIVAPRARGQLARTNFDVQSVGFTVSGYILTVQTS